MEVIMDPNMDIISFMGGTQLQKSYKNYRLNKYIIEVKLAKDVNLLYNALTGAIIKLADFELSDIYTTKDRFYRNYMIETYYFVPDNFNEDNVITEYRNKVKAPINENYLDKLGGFTILTTTACNARCPYCYQHSLKNKKHMTLETAEKVSDYIINSSFRGDKLLLDWFGGEPLFNKEVIDLITCRVGNSGREFTSSMISNSYLFDLETIIHAKNFWNLTNVQVTLDGTAPVYNKIKNYIYKDDTNPFQTIINNMHNLLRNDISISLRLNVDLNNADNLIELTKYLVEEFKDYSSNSTCGANLVIYCWPLFEIGFTRTEEERKQLCNKLSQINHIIFQNNFGHFTDYTHGIKGRHCMADSGNNVVIMPNGDLGLCEHHISDFIFGNINDPEKKDWDNINHWRQYVPYEDICKDCPIKPSCLKLGDCPSYKICSPSEKEYMIDRAKLGIIAEYNKYINRNNSCQNCSCKN